jgi:sortase A
MAEPTAPSAPANDAPPDPQPTLSAVAAPPQSDQSGLAVVTAPSTSVLPGPLEPEVARPPAHRFLRRIRVRASAPTAPPAVVDDALAGAQPTPSAVAAPAARPAPADEAPSGPLPIPLSFAAPPLSDRLGLAAIALAPVPNTLFLPGPLEPEVARTANHRLFRRIRVLASVRTIDDQHRERWVTIASWVRNIGAIILLFAAWQLWGTAITQHHSQTALKQQFQAKLPHVATKPAPGFTLIPATTQLVDPPQGSVIAQLQIPKIALSQFVVSGTGASDLALGPGHYLGTALPGQAGNVAIAGHRTTHGAPFNRLAELSIGDPIYLTTTTGQRLTYIVSATPVPVSPTNVTVLNNFGDNRLTLTTCNPEFSARQRLIVVAAYLPPGAPHPAPIAKGKGHSYKLGPAASSGWDMALAPLVLILVGLLMALGLFARRLSRIFGREGRWLILVPIWLALLLALFETLTNFLPASV